MLSDTVAHAGLPLSKEAGPSQKNGKYALLNSLSQQMRVKVSKAGRHVGLSKENNGFGNSSIFGRPTQGAAHCGVESAVVTFWELLHEFVQSSSFPGSWRRLLPMDTPFLHFPRVAHRVQVNNSVPLFVAAHVG